MLSSCSILGILKSRMAFWSKWPVFKKCCFCIPLRIGVAIVGYGAIGVLLMSIGFTINVMSSMTIESAGGALKLARAYMILTLNIIIMLVYIVLGVMLLIGAHKKKPEYLRHFFVSSLVMTKVHIVCLVFGFIYQRNWLLFVYLLWIATNVYSLLIVRSSYLAMEEMALDRAARLRKMLFGIPCS